MIGKGSLTLPGKWMLAAVLSVAAGCISLTAFAESGRTEEDAGILSDDRGPVIRAEMTGGNRDEDGIWYYRADNCGITVSVSDDFPVFPEDARIRLANGDRCIFAAVSAVSETELAAVFSPQEVAELGDGRIVLTVSAVDSAGNRTTLAGPEGPAEEEGQQAGEEQAGKEAEDGENAAAVIGLLHEQESGEASFVLDMTPPLLTGIVTNGEGRGCEEGIPYEDGCFYYHEQNLTTTFVIEETNADETSFTLQVQPEGAEKAAVSGAGEITAVWQENLRYTDISVRGMDKAGNPLEPDPQLSPDAADTVSGYVTAAAAPDGKTGSAGIISLLYGKVYDTVPPEAQIIHSPSAEAFVYAEGAEGLTACVSGGIRTRMEITDNYPTDREKLSWDQIVSAGTASEQPEAADGETVRLMWTVRADGIYAYEVCGTDRAGNPLTVTEVLEKKNTAYLGEDDPEAHRTENCAAGYLPAYTLVKDTVSPEFDLEVTEPGGEETVCGDEIYYGSSHKTVRAVFTVRDTFGDPAAVAELDPGRIGAGRVFADAEHYSDADAAWTAPAPGANHKGGGIYEVTIGEEDADGIYRFTIAGTDRAGNPLCQSAAEKGKTEAYRKTDRQEEGGFMSRKKIYDTVPPAVLITVSESFARWMAGQPYYRVRLGPEGAVTAGDWPYRRETSAYIRVDTRDHSPVMLRYAVKSGTGRSYSPGRSGGERYDPEEYTNDRAFGNTLTGQQFFSLEDPSEEGYGVLVRDRAGNTTVLKRSNRIYLDAEAPGTDIEAPAAAIIAQPADGRAADGTDLYRGSVSLTLKARDPHETTLSSGLKRVTWSITVDGRDRTGEMSLPKTLLDREEASRIRTGQDVPEGGDGRRTDRALDYAGQWTLTVPAGGIFETNDILVRLTAEDNAGNTSAAVCRFGIDTTPPQITVTYDNDSALNGRYFREARTALITVKERNPDWNRITIDTQGMVGPGFGMLREGESTGSGYTWTRSVGFAADGDYRLNIYGTDALGNEAEVSYSGTAPQSFVIDRTAPVILVGFDHHSVLNGKYYREARTAEIRITERNFSAEAVRITQTAAAPRGGRQEAPEPSGFASSGDEHLASIHYSKDGAYSLRADCTDLAGNPAAVVTVEEFVIDRTAPSVHFQHVQDRAAYAGEIAPAAVFDDACFDEEGISLTLYGASGEIRRDLPMTFTAEDGFGGTIAVSDIPALKKNDDIYTAEAVITDLAGNTARASVQFSVNRFGSAWDYNGDPVTRRALQEYYLREGRDMVLREINVSPIRNRTATLYRDGENRVLTEGQDYTVTVSSLVGGYQYLYTVYSSNFTREGQYSIVVRTEDEAGNINTNSAEKGEEGAREVPLRFAVDRTPPVNRFRDLDTSRTRWNQNELSFGIEAADEMMLRRVILTLDGKVVGDWTGEELEELLEENGGAVPFAFSAGNDWQELSVVSRDAAGNESERLVYRALVTANPAVQYFYNRPLFLGTVCGAAALGTAVLAFRLKRRSEGRGQEASRDSRIR